jgi:hypothetical protein
LQNVVQGHEKDIFKTQRRDLDYYAPKGWSHTNKR